MTTKNLLKISAYEIVQLSRTGVSNILPRFTVNYLLNKKSELLWEHTQYFSNHAETRLTFLLSGQHKLSKNDFLKDVSLDDFSILQDYFGKRCSKSLTARFSALSKILKPCSKDIYTLPVL